MSRRRQRRQRAQAPPEVQRWAAQLRNLGAKRVAKLAIERSCGDCSACCTVKSIGALRKPSFVSCARLDGGRCSIYPTRPRECAGYYCTWRMGFGPDSARPDRVGDVVVDLEHKPDVADAQHVSHHDSRAFVGTIRAGAPFKPAPVVAIVRDLRRLGVLYFGCVDRRTPDGEPYMLTCVPRSIHRMIGYFAQTGEAPWNRDPALIDEGSLSIAAESGSRGLWDPESGSFPFPKLA